MHTRWTTDPGPDPALRQAFAADQPSAVATAVVGGVDVLVTLVDEHEDFDCPLGNLHDERCPEPGLRIWNRATGALIRAVDGVCDNGTGYPAVLVTVTVDARPLAVVRDWARPPKMVDLETGRLVGTLPGHDGAADVQDLATVELADGPAVVTAGWDGILRVTALKTGRTMTLDTGARSNAVAVAHIAGRPVAATGRDALTLWDLADGSRAGVIPLSDDQVLAEIVSWPNSNPTIAVLASSGEITVWDAHTGSRDVRPPLTPRSIAAVTAADSRPLLAMSDDETVSLWDVRTDTPFRAPLAGPLQHARMLGAGPGTLLVGSPTDDAVTVWRLDAVSVWRLDDERPHVAPAQSSDIRCLTVTPDGSIVTGGGDGSLTRWRLSDGTRQPDLGSLPGRVNAVGSVLHEARTYLIAAGGDLHNTQDRTLHRWADDHPMPAVALDHGGQIDIALTVHLDGEPAILSAGADGQIHLTQVRTGLRLGTIPDTYPPRGIAVGTLAGRTTAAISRMFGPFALWDLATRRELPTPAAANVHIGEAARGWIDTATGPTVITVHESLVRMHNLHTGSVSRLQPGRSAPVTALAATAPDRPAAIAVARLDGTVSVVDAATRQDICEHRLPYAATALAWSPDDQLIAACRRALHCLAVPTD